jgi:hypothetical protein
VAAGDFPPHWRTARLRHFPGSKALEHRMAGLGTSRAHPLACGDLTDRKSNPSPHIHMKPFSTLAKRVLLASSLTLLAACGSNGITDPTAAPRKSGYLTVSADTKKVTVTLPVVPVTVTVSESDSGKGKKAKVTATAGYNVPAN